jgi:cytochrome c5
VLALLAAPQIFHAGSARAAQDAAIEPAVDGGKLWSQECGRCHNKRSPEKFSDAQWQVIVHHMRVRAYLTGTESRAIIDFLKSAN